MEDDEIAELANRIALKPQEMEAVQALRLLVPDIQRVQIVDFGGERLPMAAVGADRVPLRSFGDGVVR